MIEYIVNVTNGRKGVVAVRLARLGSWGNIPYATVNDAIAAAEADAAGATHRIVQRKTLLLERNA